MRSTVTLSSVAGICVTQSARALCSVYSALLSETGGSCPRKADLDPSRLGALVNHVFLFAVSKPRTCVVRLVAEQARHHTGRERERQDYYRNVPEDRVEIAARALNMAVTVPCGFRVDVRHEYALGRTRDFESLLLPLVSDEQGVDGFLLGTSELSGKDAGKGLPAERSHGNIVLQRDLVDIGFGVEETFVDLVPR